VRTFSGAENPWPSKKIPLSGSYHLKIACSTPAQELDFPQHVQRYCL
jgi:hypothetical protein